MCTPITILSDLFYFYIFKVHHHADSLARDVPCRQSESPSSWWRCPLWWFLWKPAKETSGQTWSGWWTAGGYIGSTRIYLQEAVGFRMNHWILKKKTAISNYVITFLPQMSNPTLVMVTLQSGRSYDGETVHLQDKDICELLYTVWSELLDFLTFSKIKSKGWGWWMWWNSGFNECFKNYYNTNGWKGWQCSYFCKNKPKLD